MKLKLKLFLLPYFIISVCFASLYWLFCWFIYKEQGAIEIDEMLINFWIPFVVPWIPALIWLRPRFKLLKYRRDGRRDPDTAITMLTCFTIAISTIIGIIFMQNALGKLTSLNDIESIDRVPRTKFYTVKKYFVDKNHKGVYYTSHTSGRYSSTLNLDIYIACPMYNSAEEVNAANEITKIGAIVSGRPDTSVQLSVDSILIIVNGLNTSRNELNKIPPEGIQNVSVLKGKAATAVYGASAKGGVMIITTKKSKEIVDEHIISKPPKAWLGVTYHKEIANYQKSSNKKDKEHKFYSESLKNFYNTNLSTFSYLDRLGDNDNRSHYWVAASKAYSNLNAHTAIIFELKYESYATRTEHKLLWVFLSYAIGTSILLLIIATSKFDESTLKMYLNKKNGQKNCK